MFKQFLYSPCCLKCASILCDESLFCYICYKKEILSRLEQSEESHLGSHHFYLFEWPKNDKDFMNEFVYRLKSNRAKMAWKFYVEIFYYKLQDEIKFNQYQALVPIPGSTKQSMHAQIFSKYLSEFCGLPVKDILIKKSQNSQKSLSAMARKSSTNFEIKNPNTEHFTKYIFVDDVLTTGESFLKSQSALKASAESLILSLFYRPRVNELHSIV